MGGNSCVKEFQYQTELPPAIAAGRDGDNGLKG